MKSDYLKYYKVVRKFIKEKHGLTQSDLDTLFFLRSEGLFTSTNFDEFNKIVSWDRLRLDRLRQNGWVEIYRDAPKDLKPGKIGVVYRLTYKAKRVIDTIYEYLNGRSLPMTQTSNPLMAKNVPFSSKVHRNFIRNLNKKIKTGQHKQ